jgi:hypothetical protein
MTHSEHDWRAEIRAHAPLACDLIDMSWECLDMPSWLGEIGEEPGLKKSLESWQGFIQMHRLAVVIEQASADAELLDSRAMTASLRGCPAEWRVPFDIFMQAAPKPIRDYLVYACCRLVAIERERRTGHPVWGGESPSGSPEVLNQLMFKWGPRFKRHRWT